MTSWPVTITPVTNYFPNLSLTRQEEYGIKRFSKKSLKIPKGGNQNLYIEEQTTQWPKEKVQKDKQRSIKHMYIKLKIE